MPLSETVWMLRAGGWSEARGWVVGPAGLARSLMQSVSGLGCCCSMRVQARPRPPAPEGVVGGEQHIGAEQEGGAHHGGSKPQPHSWRLLPLTPAAQRGRGEGNHAALRHCEEWQRRQAGKQGGTRQVGSSTHPARGLLSVLSRLRPLSMLSTEWLTACSENPTCFPMAPACH